jgi:hypothetical protein
MGNIVSIFSIAAANAPTPGKTKCVASWISLISFEIILLNPSLSNEFLTEATFPEP